MTMTHTNKLQVVKSKKILKNTDPGQVDILIQEEKNSTN
jgi:hypothetical protein